MKVSKDQVVEFIRSRGDDAAAERAQQELPDSIDLSEDEGLLAQYGVQSEDLSEAPGPG